MVCHPKYFVGLTYLSFQRISCHECNEMGRRCVVQFVRGVTCLACKLKAIKCSFRVRQPVRAVAPAPGEPKGWSRLQEAYIVWRWVSTATEQSTHPQEGLPSFVTQTDYAPPKAFTSAFKKLARRDSANTVTFFPRDNTDEESSSDFDEEQKPKASSSKSTTSKPSSSRTTSSTAPSSKSTAAAPPKKLTARKTAVPPKASGSKPGPADLKPGPSASREPKSGPKSEKPPKSEKVKTEEKKRARATDSPDAPPAKRTRASTRAGGDEAPKQGRTEGPTTGGSRAAVRVPPEQSPYSPFRSSVQTSHSLTRTLGSCSYSASCHGSAQSCCASQDLWASQR